MRLQIPFKFGAGYASEKNLIAIESAYNAMSAELESLKTRVEALEV